MTVKSTTTALRTRPTSKDQPSSSSAPRPDAEPPVKGGWGPKAGAAPSTSGADGFGAPRRQAMESLGQALSAAAPEESGPPGPAQQALVQSVDDFTAKLQTILHHDAKSLAQGLVPTRAGDALTAAQQKQLDGAAVDFLKGIPMGALAPETAQRLQARLKAANVDVGDVSTTKLGDLGPAGRELARDLVKSMRRSSPAAYYGLAGGLAAVAGYTGWTKGSQGLLALGIKPEVKKSFFDDRLSVTLAGDFGAKLKDFKVTGTVAGQTTFANGGHASGSLVAKSRTGVDSAQAAYSIDKPNWNFSAAWARAADGKQSGAVTAGVKNDVASASVAVSQAADGLRSVVVKGSATPNANLNVSGTVTHDLSSGVSAAEVDAFLTGSGGERVTANVHADSRVGLQAATLGLTIDRANFSASATATVNPGGLASAELKGHVTRGALGVDASVTANADGIATVAASATYAPSADLNLTAGVSGNVQTGAAKATAELAWKVNGKTDLAATASADTLGHQGVTVGIRGKF